MKHTRAILLAAASILLAGCSSTPTKVDNGPIRARTFSFVVPRKQAPASADNRALIHNLIQSAITKNLTARGLNRVSGGGDVTVAYLVIKGDELTTQYLNDYFGYSDDLEGLRDRAHMAYTGSEKRGHFEAGTLLIDVVDGKTGKLLKRGYATRPLLRDLPSDARAERIQGVVDEILRDLRISK